MAALCVAKPFPVSATTLFESRISKNHAIGFSPVFIFRLNGSAQPLDFRPVALTGIWSAGHGPARAKAPRPQCYSPPLIQNTANARCIPRGDPWYFGYPMSDAPQRFGRLAAQFEVMAHNLTVCQDPKQRRELLIGMMAVLKQMDDILMSDPSLSSSKPDSTAPSDPPLRKAAHQ